MAQVYLLVPKESSKQMVAYRFFSSLRSFRSHGGGRSPRMDGILDASTSGEREIYFVLAQMVCFHSRNTLSRFAPVRSCTLELRLPSCATSGQRC